MKYLFSMFILLLFACKTQNNTSTKVISIIKEEQVVWQDKIENEIYQTVEKISLLPDSRITLEHNEAGKTYVKIRAGDKNVFRYSYHKRIKDSTIQDAFVTESIYFEWKGDLYNTHLSDKKLSDENLTVSFTRFRNSDALAVSKGQLTIEIINKHKAIIYIKIDENKLPLPVTEINKIINIK